MRRPNPVDDVIVISGARGDQDTLVDLLRRAFDRVAELIERQGLVLPIGVSLTDADGRCLLTTSLGETGWVGQTEPGELDQRGAIAFPWLLELQDGTGRVLRIRVELDSPSKPM